MGSLVSYRAFFGQTSGVFSVVIEWIFGRYRANAEAWSGSALGHGSVQNRGTERSDGRGVHAAGEDMAFIASPRRLS